MHDGMICKIFSRRICISPPFPAKSKKDNNYNINPNGIGYIKYHIGVDFQKVIINTFIFL